MKVVLVLCLLAFMSCQKDITEIGKCIYESPKVKELISDVMVAIVTKDFSKLWPKIQSSLPELIQVVIKCVTEENEDVVNLQNYFKICSKTVIDKCCQNCINQHADESQENTENCYKVCAESCGRAY